MHQGLLYVMMCGGFEGIIQKKKWKEKGKLYVLVGTIEDVRLIHMVSNCNPGLLLQIFIS